MKILFGIVFDNEISSFQKTVLEQPQNIEILKEQLHTIYDKDLNIQLMCKSHKVSDLYIQAASDFTYGDDLPF